MCTTWNISVRTILKLSHRTHTAYLGPLLNQPQYMNNYILEIPTLCIIVSYKIRHEEKAAYMVATMYYEQFCNTIAR